MQFQLIDRITEVKDSKQLRAVKVLALSEEYLADHFPDYPVLPGVLVLEAMVQAAAWLIRSHTDFQLTLFYLAKAGNVTYGQFVRPGDRMDIEAKLLKESDGEWQFQGKATRDGDTVARARFTVRATSLVEQYGPGMANMDAELRRAAREQWGRLTLGM